MTTQNKQQLLDTLAALGESAFKDNDITQRGTELIIPEQMTVSRAIDTLSSFQESQRAETEFIRDFHYRPMDGAVATSRALVKLTGTPGIGQAVISFFGSSPPRMIQVPTGVDTNVMVPWGEIYVELWEGYLTTESVMTDDGGIYRLVVHAARGYGPVIEGFFRLIEEELQRESIYRGKALYGDLTFYDPFSINPAEVIYTEEVLQQIETNLWSPLKDTQAIRDAGLPIKRTVLLQGAYGTGKTLTGALTAQVAVENEWTFIYSRPEDDLHDVLATARLYAPAVVFSEDIDRTASPDKTNDDASAMLDLFDGLGAKGREVLLILTSNHPENLHKGIVRPGRLDAIIELADMDAAGIARLIDVVIGDAALDGVDHQLITDSVKGYSPAYVREVLDRAKRYAIARNGKLDNITTEDIVGAAHGLRYQLQLMEDAPEHTEGVALHDAFAELVDQQLQEMNLVLKDRYGDVSGYVAHAKVKKEA